MRSRCIRFPRSTKSRRTSPTRCGRRASVDANEILCSEVTTEKEHNVSRHHLVKTRIQHFSKVVKPFFCVGNHHPGSRGSLPFPIPILASTLQEDKRLWGDLGDAAGQQPDCGFGGHGHSYTFCNRIWFSRTYTVYIYILIYLLHMRIYPIYYTI